MLAALVLVLTVVASVEVARFVAGSRRAHRLNGAVHELRRPLQSISLSLERATPDLRCAGACLEQMRTALEDLDAAINGRAVGPRIVRTALDEVASGLQDRWRLAGVEVRTLGSGVPVQADPARLGAALDNLVANAVEHGSGPISVRAHRAPGSVRFEVLDGGPAAPRAPDRTYSRRHGHGLRLARELAGAQGGTLISPRSLPSGQTMAAISLPAPQREPEQG